MSAARLVEVTVVMAWSPGAPGGDSDHRIVFSVALDAQGQPDGAAWLADPAPWPARRDGPGQSALAGDVVHDEDGWSLRFYRDPAAAPDAPVHRLLHRGAPRPGEMLTIRDPEGVETAWRVVGIG